MTPKNFVILSEAKNPASRSPAVFQFRTALAVLLITFLATSCTTPPASQPKTQNPEPQTTSSASTADPLASLTYDHSQQPVADLDHAIALAGNDPAKLAPIADHLFALLHSPATTFAARQAICQRLVEFPSALLTTDDALGLFAAMLADDKQVNFARLALEPVRGEKIDALFLSALEKSKPATKVALIQSAGNRHLAAAVPLLTPCLRDPDPLAASAAVRALAQIATADALASLAQAPNPDAPDVIEARLTIARALPPASAVSIYNDIIGTTAAPANLRAAALRGLLDAEPASAAAQIVTVLSGHDVVVKPVVIEAIAAHPAKNLTSALAANLSAFDPPTQAAVIAALGRRGDPAANRAIATAAESNDADVRSAALAALGELPGSPETAAALAEIAAHGASADAKLARQSLARLNGPGVADAVIAGATRGAPALRAVYLEAIGDRYMTESVPLLLQIRSDPDAAVRVAALGSLADIGPASAQSAILDWAVHTTDAAEQSRALRALANVTLRNPDVDARAQPIVAAIESATPALALRLIPVLSRLGGKTAVACAARLAARDDADLANAAILVLSHWPDIDGLDPLIATAADAARPGIRAAALDAAIRYLERDRTIRSPELTTDLSRLLAAASQQNEAKTPEHDTRARLVRLLGRCSDDAAVKLAEQQGRNPALAGAAADAALAIHSNQAGAPAISVSSSTWSAHNLIDGNTATRWSVGATAEQWFQLDFHSSRPFHHLVLDETNREDEFPVGYAVFVTDDPKNPGAPRVTGEGRPGRTSIDLPAGTRGRYLLVRHVGERDGTAWTVAEVLID
jgi:HEAT repeat protein